MPDRIPGGYKLTDAEAREVLDKSDPNLAAWREAQQWEAGWWGNCVHTFAEEAKQCTYAHRMGLVNVGVDGGRWPLYDLGGKKVVDLGGGPVSMLLKCFNLGRAVVVDPGEYPEWVMARYRAARVECLRRRAEDYDVVDDALSGITAFRFDEAWLYNVLQHVIDPERIVANARSIAATVRIFEWIDLPPYQGHLHELKQPLLDKWLGTTGTVETITENGIVAGRAYYAVAE